MRWQREVSELTAIPDTTQTPKGVNWEWWAASELGAVMTVSLFRPGITISSR